MLFTFRDYLKSQEAAFWGKRRNRRLTPSLLQHDYLVNQALSQDIKTSFRSIRRQFKKDKYAFVDIGCGQKPYLSIFQPYVKRYIGVDVDPKRADVVAPGDKLPFNDASFDIAVSFQTLEHCEEPEKVVAEIYRVLKSGGYAILTTHGAWMYHPGPHDFYRWTGEGLKRLFKKFRIVVVKPNLRAPASIIQLANLELYGIACRNLFWKLPLYLVILVLNIFGMLLMHLGQEHFTVNYIVVAQKI